MAPSGTTRKLHASGLSRNEVYEHVTSHPFQFKSTLNEVNILNFPRNHRLRLIWSRNGCRPPPVAQSILFGSVDYVCSPIFRVQLTVIFDKCLKKLNANTTLDLRRNMS